MKLGEAIYKSQQNTKPEFSKDGGKRKRKKTMLLMRIF